MDVTDEEIPIVQGQIAEPEIGIGIDLVRAGSGERTDGIGLAAEVSGARSGGRRAVILLHPDGEAVELGIVDSEGGRIPAAVGPADGIGVGTDPDFFGRSVGGWTNLDGVFV